MAKTEELISQVAAADTADQLDAVQASTQDSAVLQAIALRREEIGASTAAQRRATIEATSMEVGENATTEPESPKDHYFLASDGKTHINAWGEEKGSPEDKKRW